MQACKLVGRLKVKHFVIDEFLWLKFKNYIGVIIISHTYFSCRRTDASPCTTNVQVKISRDKIVKSIETNKRKQINLIMKRRGSLNLGRGYVQTVCKKSPRCCLSTGYGRMHYRRFLGKNWTTLLYADCKKILSGCTPMIRTTLVRPYMLSFICCTCTRTNLYSSFIAKESEKKDTIYREESKSDVTTDSKEQLQPPCSIYERVATTTKFGYIEDRYCLY